MRSRIVLFGIGDFARTAFVYLRDDSPYEVTAFTVHDSYRQADTLLGRPVVPFEGLAESHPPDRYAMFVAVGYSRINKARAEIYYACKSRGYEMITYVSSRACRAGEVVLGDNCFVQDDVVLQPFVRIGNNVILWSGCHIGHDSTVADHCFVAPRAALSGNVRVGESCFIGLNATIRDGVTVAPATVVGAGALILGDTRPGEVYKGNEAELLPVSSSQLKGL